MTSSAPPLAAVPDPDDPPRLDPEAADRLGAQLCVAAGAMATTQSRFLTLLGEFDAGRGHACFDGVRSIAHWLAWACSMSPGTAREHVRVARALRRMPSVAEAFADGRLSYSKVRELTRAVDVVDEAYLCQLALVATASQLARSIAAFRSANSTRLQQEQARSVRWVERESGVVDVRIRLPKDQAAVIISALTTAQDAGLAAIRGELAAERDQPAPIPADDSVDPDQRFATRRPADRAPTYALADAALDLARAYLAAAPEDRSGEDRTLVVVHVAASLLGADVPAGTSPAEEPTCHIQGLGPVDPTTAQRLACDCPVVGAVVDGGQVLALGRTRRLASRAQRRALMIRDRGCCQFPGCSSVRRLKAHHLLAWAQGGPTDLDNLILVCQFHHTAVHEGGVRILRRPDGTDHTGVRWDFVLPDGSLIPDWLPAENLTDRLVGEEKGYEGLGPVSPVIGWSHPDAVRVRPGWRGEKFDLAATVAALFGHLDQNAEAAA